MTMTKSEIKRGFIQRFGRTNADLERAEDQAHAMTARHDGSKVHLVVEAFAEGETVGSIFVTDEDGHETLANDDRFVLTAALNSYGWEA